MAQKQFHNYPSLTFHLSTSKMPQSNRGTVKDYFGLFLK